MGLVILITDGDVGARQGDEGGIYVAPVCQSFTYTVDTLLAGLTLDVEENERKKHKHFEFWLIYLWQNRIKFELVIVDETELEGFSYSVNL